MMKHGFLAMAGLALALAAGTFGWLVGRPGPSSPRGPPASSTSGGCSRGSRTGAPVGEQAARADSLAHDLRQLAVACEGARTKAELAERRAWLDAKRQEMVDRGRAALPALAELLHDERLDVRLAAGSVLGRMRGPFTAELLAAAAANDRSKAVRTSALMYLAQLHPAAQVSREELIRLTQPALLAALADGDPDVRRMAQKAQWNLARRLEGYEADGSPTARQAALDKLRAAAAGGG